MIVSFSPPLCVFSLPFSHHLRHEIAHLLRGTFLHLPRDMGVTSTASCGTWMRESGKRACQSFAQPSVCIARLHYVFLVQQNGSAGLDSEQKLLSRGAYKSGNLRDVLAGRLIGALNIRLEIKKRKNAVDILKNRI